MIFEVKQSKNLNAELKGIQRWNSYAIILISTGEGIFEVDESKYKFSKNCIICLSPYQAFRLKSRNQLTGSLITFHSDFLCVYKHHKEVACNGTLFENMYYPPHIQLQDQDMASLTALIQSMAKEIAANKLAKSEVLVSLLKILLINVVRIKVSQYPDMNKKIRKHTPPILVSLKDRIESDYKKKHAPVEYAESLHMSTKQISKLAKDFFGKSIRDLIQERILIEAKRELYLTSKTVKQISFELGFKDEFYFSRLFKNKTNVSPQQYRTNVGYAKAETMES